MSVYLDHAATSPLRPELVTVSGELAALVGNPSSLHRPGQRARAVLEEAREELAATVGAHPTEVIFTSGGSEADSIAVLGGWARRREDGRERCLVSAIEHPAVLGATAWGAELMPVTSDGVLDVAAATQLIDDTAAVVSVMAVNNETGVVQPVAEVAELARASGAWMHTDAVQALGHLPVDFAASGADLMSLSAHKIGGPVGVGALLARREVVPRATGLGGGQGEVVPRATGLGGGQERELRSGTVPVALAAAFARAASLAVEDLETEAARLRALSGRIAEAAVAAGGRLNSREDGAPHIVNVTFDGVRADDLLFLLDQRGIHASVGSACKAGVHQPSDVLLAMGRTPDEAVQSLRFSIGWSTTDADIDEACRALPEALAQARAAF
ncbi:cysteine desulfurase family protein [Tessaracoccus massiliensis]|uniref:cysteine desulfurase family protein n=1 Tax=Tessaracoccus massiliensis TaxID=1522311 RepID=UPI00058B9F01|nr:cysteine desulfurase family protein [Tessaracoccus massiliensis]